MAVRMHAVIFIQTTKAPPITTTKFSMCVHVTTKFSMCVHVSDARLVCMTKCMITLSLKVPIYSTRGTKSSVTGLATDALSVVPIDVQIVSGVYAGRQQ